MLPRGSPFTFLKAGSDSASTFSTMKKTNSLMTLLSLNAVLCYGPGFMYTVKAPEGWVLDNKSGQGSGVCLVSYPQGSSWEKGETVVYFNPSQKSNDPGNRNLSDVIAYDLKNHQANSPKLKVSEGEAYTNSFSKKKIPTKFFTNDQNNHEAVAYIDEPKAVVFLVMSSRTEAGLKKNLPAFKAFAENYQLITSQVETKKK